MLISKKFTFGLALLALAASSLLAFKRDGLASGQLKVRHQRHQALWA